MTRSRLTENISPQTVIYPLGAHFIMPTPQEAYSAAVTTLRDLGNVLAPSVEARFTAPPGSPCRVGDGPGNPTLDTVLDPRRMRLSDEVAAAATALHLASITLSRHTTALSAALSAWEGGERN